MISLKDLFEDIDPYRNAPMRDLDLQGWGSDHPIFASLIRRLKPKLIVEIGTWKGASAVHMAHILQQGGTSCHKGAKILCVDTWLGSLEMWQRPGFPDYDALGLQNGYPSVYYTFLSNVIQSRAQNTIIPCPMTSLQAARWLSARKVRPELVYIDGSHDAHDVRFDVLRWFDVLRPGGVLLGDDYDDFWPSVRAGVSSARCDLPDHRFRVAPPNKWVIFKYP